MRTRLQGYSKQKLYEAHTAHQAGCESVKTWQNSNAALSIVYLFFIIYQKSKVWTITRFKNLNGCCLSPFIFS
ncbi:hypothetical protein DWV72_02175 [Firmicutes bacterium AF12-30]|nr:hypothetical protein DWV72_02175 [Firmicutes bacterium AF12-30]